MGYFDDVFNKKTKSVGYFDDIFNTPEQTGGYSVAPVEIQQPVINKINQSNQPKPQTTSGQFSTVMPNIGGTYVKPPQEIQKQLEENKITSDAAKKFTKQSLQTILDKTINTEKGKIIVDKIASPLNNLVNQVKNEK